MLNWIKKNIISKIKLRREDNVPQRNRAVLETTQQKQIESDKPKSRLELLQQYNDVISPVLLYSTTPELPEDMWRLIISHLSLGGLSAIPFVSKLFNKIWKNINVENTSTMGKIFGDNGRYSKLPYRRKLVSGFGMLSLLERSLELLQAEDYDNLLLVVQKILRYSSMLHSVCLENLSENAFAYGLKDYHRVFYYDMSLNNLLIAHWGTDSEAHSKSCDVKCALFGKDGHYIDVEYKYNSINDFGEGLAIKDDFKITLKSLNDEKQFQDIIRIAKIQDSHFNTRVDKSEEEIRKIGDWLGGSYNEYANEWSIYRIIYKLAIHPQALSFGLKVDRDAMTLEQVFQYAIRVFLNGNSKWQYELSLMALQAVARLTTLSRIKKYRKDRGTENYDSALNKIEGEDDSIARRAVGRKRKIDQISNTERTDNSERPTKRSKLAFDTCHSKSEVNLHDNEVAELFLNAQFSRWRSDARVFYHIGEEDASIDSNDSNSEDAFDNEQREKYLMRLDRLKFNLYSKDKSQTARFEFTVEEFFDIDGDEMQNSFNIHIQAADQEFHMRGYESDSIEDVIKDVDQVVVDTLQLEHINTKQFASLLCAICDQHENTEVMKKIRAKRNNEDDDE